MVVLDNSKKQQQRITCFGTVVTSNGAWLGRKGCDCKGASLLLSLLLSLCLCLFVDSIGVVVRGEKDSKAPLHTSCFPSCREAEVQLCKAGMSRCSARAFHETTSELVHRLE